ncbi:MAG: hypothetical protein ACFFAN_09130 [Promethearchaeota archaeon]
MISQYGNLFGGMSTGTIILILIIWFIIYLIIITIFLKIALHLFKAENTGFGSVFLTALICTILFAVFFINIFCCCIGCILCWFVINARHKTGFGGAIVVSILALIIGFIITIIIIVIILMALNISFVFWPF